MKYEKLARKLVTINGANPDQLVQLGQPDMYGTSAGRAFAIDPSKGKPLWTFFIAAAREAHEAAIEELKMIAGSPCILNTTAFSGITSVDMSPTVVGGSEVNAA